MKLISIRRNRLREAGIEGLLIVLATTPFVFFSKGHAGTFETIRHIVAILSSALFIASAWYILRKPIFGKIFSGIAATGNLVVLFPLLKNSPGISLAVVAIYILAIDSLLHFKIHISFHSIEENSLRSLQRSRWAIVCVIAISFISFLILDQTNFYSDFALFSALLTAQILSLIWSFNQNSKRHKLALTCLNILMLLSAYFFYQQQTMWFGVLCNSMVLFAFLPGSRNRSEELRAWWEPLITHPARLTLVAFFMLCALGTIFLILPAAAASDSIKLIDAAFTSVSAVCVTGLIVLDTPNDFSFMGQFFIIILIQLGGLGIMTVSSVTLYALGRRLSLKQERMMVTSFDPGEYDLLSSLLQIVKFTGFMELTGAVVLTTLFYYEGFEFTVALWKGIFTAISAFCNAGFALQSDSLIQFQNNPLILHMVAILIVCGGIAPAVTMIIPKWLSGKIIPVSAKIALTTTLVLLVFGTFFILAFEWNGVLANMSLFDKVHNAWFQSATLRTAGFNSVAIENVVGPTFLIMICFMFIGGSPGGTAGGIKTTTFGVLMGTFWSSIIGNEDLIIQDRRITPATVYKAVTTVVAGISTLVLVVLMLEVTQSSLARDLIFEAASALGTVGLSTGATAKLDSIGKIIIMFAMFAGRVGPLTLLTILSREKPVKSADLLEARVNLS
jgi:trk system potassium uptake protein TrkH